VDNADSGVVAPTDRLKGDVSGVAEDDDANNALSPGQFPYPTSFADSVGDN
jgi:hypothetical protein